MPSIDEQLAELYRSKADSILRFAYVLTSDREVARDLTHEAFARVGGRLGALRDPEQAAAYLYRTTLNLVRSHGRFVRREGALRSKLINQVPISAEVPSPTDDALWTSILDLPDRQKAAIFFRYYADLTEHQTAELLGCSAGAVKSLVRRALSTLREEVTRPDGKR